MANSTAESQKIAAPAAQVWELVSDLTRMGQWSPENQGGSWSRGASAPALGAVFRGRNKSGVRRWSTAVTVTECEPGQVFEFSVSMMAVPVANWRYEFEETEGGCTVTESWQDNRASWARAIGRVAGDHGAEHAKGEMAATLANLAKVAEASGA
jgi:uncharacterized protein YndB with AHSA1/START domain